MLLVAEDDLDDQLLIRDALEMLVSGVDLRFVDDGSELLSYLSSDAPLPKLILLDLNMPRMGGRTVLKELRANPVLAEIPVVVLTTSHAENDMESALKLGATEFYRKPSSFLELIRLLDQLVARFM
jgi:CheY-like chemotaxis protein